MFSLFYINIPISWASFVAINIGIRSPSAQSHRSYDKKYVGSHQQFFLLRSQWISWVVEILADRLILLYSLSPNAKKYIKISDPYIYILFARFHSKCNLYLGNGKHCLHVIFLHIQPVSQSGVFRIVTCRYVLFQLIRFHMLVFNVPDQFPSLPQLWLVTINNIQPVENFMRPETN